LLKDGFVVNTILKEADLFCPNSVRINFTIYHNLNQQFEKCFAAEPEPIPCHAYKRKKSLAI
ncbi:hypothetical protein, partial [Lactiplantibacillus plantarum]|uniref:hypothetical protein n=1 Tax=Lactiplantibacillus plantarum TaxID=1590 RepID=UPI00218249E0